MVVVTFLLEFCDRNQLQESFQCVINFLVFSHLGFCHAETILIFGFEISYLVMIHEHKYMAFLPSLQCNGEKFISLSKKMGHETVFM